MAYLLYCSVYLFSVSQVTVCMVLCISRSVCSSNEGHLDVFSRLLSICMRHTEHKRQSLTSFPKTGKTLENTLIKPTLSLFNTQNFVTERKIDEELARTTRFVGDKDELKSMIANFGEGNFEN